MCAGASKKENHDAGNVWSTYLLDNLYFTAPFRECNFAMRPKFELYINLKFDDQDANNSLTKQSTSLSYIIMQSNIFKIMQVMYLFDMPFLG